MSYVKKMLSGACNALGDFLMPRTCVICGEKLPKGRMIVCDRCFLQLPRTGLQSMPEDNEMTDRIAVLTVPVKACAWIYYLPDEPSAELIRYAKYHGMPALAYRLGRNYATELRDGGFDPESDVLLPVGMHTLKEFRREYNQASEIAKGMSDVWGIPVGMNIKAKKGHSTQTHKNAEQRSRNISGVFTIEHPEELDGRRLAIVDDIVTTGATLSECIRTILIVCRPLSITVLTIGLTRLRQN